MKKLLNFLKQNLVLIVLVILVTFLRLWKINKEVIFIGDFGWFYLSARDMLIANKIPLVGISSSVPVFKQGAIFTWILAAILGLFNFNPYAPAVMMGLLGIATIVLLYKYSQKYFGKRVALYASFFAASSPFMVINSRVPYHTAPIFIVTLVLAHISTQIAKGEKEKMFLLGLTLSILYQLEIAAIVVGIAIFLTYVWSKVAFRLIHLIKFTAGVVIGALPFVIYDLQTGEFLQTLGFPVWMIVKVMERLTLLGKGSFSLEGLSNLQRLVFPYSFILTTILLTFAIFVYARGFRSKEKLFSENLVLVWGVLGIFSFVVRGVISEAYLPLVFLPISIIIGNFFDKYSKKSSIFSVIFIFIVFFNSYYLVRTNYLIPEVYGPSLDKKLEVVGELLELANGNLYSLSYIGPGDIYESGGMQYEYLLWYLGNAPVEKSTTTFVVKENIGNIRIEKVQK